jgi:hypothetical protein
MYKLHRTVRVSRGKFPEALKWTKEYLEYVNANYAPISFQAYSEIFGDVGTLHWFSDLEDLATFEAFLARIREDQESEAHIERAADLFIEASGHDTLMRLL